jgi:hypothetical protein
MNAFIDLQGASGQAYRFRLWSEGTPHLPIAGNYVVVRQAAEGFKVVLAGVTNDLSACRAQLRKETSREGAHLYTRLNVSRTARTAEHEDVVAHYKPAVVKAET